MISWTSPPEQKLPPAPVSTTASNVACVRQTAKEIAQLGVGIEGQRILLLRPIERERCHVSVRVHLPAEMGRVVIAKRPAVVRHVHRLPLLRRVRARGNRLAAGHGRLQFSEQRVEPLAIRPAAGPRPCPRPSAHAPRPSRRTHACRRRSGAPRARAGRRRWRAAPRAPRRRARSVMPVTLPPVTMSRRDSSPMRKPSGLRSSCAIRSKRGSVVAKRSRRRARTRPRSASCTSAGAATNAAHRGDRRETRLLVGGPDRPNRHRIHPEASGTSDASCAARARLRSSCALPDRYCGGHGISR